MSKHLLPKLTDNEYETLLSCLAHRQFSKCCGLLTSKTIDELIQKIQGRTIEPNTKRWSRRRIINDRTAKVWME